MSIPFTFPVSPEIFAAYQEKLLGCPLADNEREAMGAWVPVFNDSYSKGIRNDVGDLRDSVSCMDQLIEEYSGNPTITKFLEASRRWIIYAWKQGNAQRPTPPV